MRFPMGFPFPRNAYGQLASFVAPGPCQRKVQNLVPVKARWAQQGDDGRYLGVSLKFMGFLVCVFSHIMLFFCFFNVIGHAGFFWHMFFF